MEDLKEKQSKSYLEEAELSLETAQIIFDKAKEGDKDFWANVIKICYDSIEQAISAAIAKKNQRIPKEHPSKIKKFINLFEIDEELKEKLYFWLRKRSSSQYVDIKDDKISIPHELFDESDAQKALDDAREIIEKVKGTIALAMLSLPAKKLF